MFYDFRFNNQDELRSISTLDMNSSGLTKMPTPTSKIPLPKTSLPSYKSDQDIPISSPPGSKIPLIKSLKPSGNDVNR